MRNKLQLSLLCVIFAAIAVLGGCKATSKTTDSTSEAYPSHQIKLIVPFGAGSGVDSQARALKKVAVKYLHQPLLVFNKPGGGGNLGLYELVKAKQDGYTLGIASPEVIFHSIYGNEKYQYVTALEPLAQISSAPLFLVVHAESPWNSVDDLIQYGKSTPLKFSHGGIGSASHVIGEIFGKLNHIKTLQVPFKVSSEKVSMLLGKHVDATFISYVAVKEHVEAGKLKLLASTGSKRLENSFLANVPTLKELNMEIEFTDWFGIAAPKSLPPEIRSKLTVIFKDMIFDPEVAVALKANDVQIEYLDPAESQKK